MDWFPPGRTQNTLKSATEDSLEKGLSTEVRVVPGATEHLPLSLLACRGNGWKVYGMTRSTGGCGWGMFTELGPRERNATTPMLQGDGRTITILNAS
jgi:hypothetical protein